VYHKHLIITIVSDSVLLDDIAQSDDIGDGFLVVPHVRMIARHLCLVGNHHGSTIALQSHTLAGSESLFH
jgi:hypothetical protein